MTDQADDSLSENVQQQEASVDRDRIAELTQAIDDGRYVIDPARIAEELVDRGFPRVVNPG